MHLLLIFFQAEPWLGFRFAWSHGLRNGISASIFFLNLIRYYGKTLRVHIFLNEFSFFRSLWVADIFSTHAVDMICTSWMWSSFSRSCDSSTHLACQHQFLPSIVGSCRVCSYTFSPLTCVLSLSVLVLTLLPFFWYMNLVESLPFFIFVQFPYPVSPDYVLV